MRPLFLDAAELRTLTGSARAAHQIEQLRRMGVPFWINRAGRPIVACSAVEGAGPPADKPASSWQPAALAKA